MHVKQKVPQKQMCFVYFCFFFLTALLERLTNIFYFFSISTLGTWYQYWTHYHDLLCSFKPRALDKISINGRFNKSVWSNVAFQILKTLYLDCHIMGSKPGWVMNEAPTSEIALPSDFDHLTLSSHGLWLISHHRVLVLLLIKN